MNNIEFSIDTWPMIPAFVQVEATSEKKVIEGLKLIGLEKNEHGHYGHVKIYREYGIDLHSMPELKFEESNGN